MSVTGTVGLSNPTLSVTPDSPRRWRCVHDHRQRRTEPISGTFLDCPKARRSRVRDIVPDLLWRRRRNDVTLTATSGSTRPPTSPFRSARPPRSSPARTSGAITVRNNGPSTATGVALMRCRPARASCRLRRARARARRRDSYRSPDRSTAGAGASVAIVVSTTASSPSPIVNTASASASTSDPVGGNTPPPHHVARVFGADGGRDAAGRHRRRAPSPQTCSAPATASAR